MPTEFTEGYYDESIMYKYDADGKQIVDNDMVKILSDEPVWPKHWRRNIPKVVQATLVFGLVHLGWTVKDYIINAIQQGGFELVIIWGAQGCLPTYQNIQTSQGIMTVKEIVELGSIRVPSLRDNCLEYNRAFPIYSGEKKIYKVETDNGHFFSSDEQPFLVDGEWKVLESINCDERLSTRQGKTQILSIRPFSVEPTYDFMVENAHNFFLDNWVLTHNSGKSNRLLQVLNWAHGNWELVLQRIEYTPKSFVKRLKELPKGQRFPILGWDDLTVHMTSASHKLDPKVYSGIDSALAAIRTKCNVLVVTTPHIERLPANVRANATLEIFLGRNQTMLCERICKLPSYYNLTGFLTKVQVEPLRRFNLFDVPYEIYQRYEDSRIKLADDAIDNLDSLIDTTQFDAGNWISILDAAEEQSLSINNLNQMIKNKIVRTTEFNDMTYIWKEDSEKVGKIKGRRGL